MYPTAVIKSPHWPSKAVFLAFGSPSVVASMVLATEALFSSSKSSPELQAWVHSSMVSKLFSLPWQPPKMKSLQVPMEVSK